MPTGPRGEKRPSNPNAAAVMVAKIATGEIKEQYEGEAPSKGSFVPLRTVSPSKKSDD